MINPLNETYVDKSGKTRYFMSLRKLNEVRLSNAVESYDRQFTVHTFAEKTQMMLRDFYMTKVTNYELNKYLNEAYNRDAMLKINREINGELTHEDWSAVWSFVISSPVINNVFEKCFAYYSDKRYIIISCEFLFQKNFYNRAMQQLLAQTPINCKVVFEHYINLHYLEKTNLNDRIFLEEAQNLPDDVNLRAYIEAETKRRLEKK